MTGLQRDEAECERGVTKATALADKTATLLVIAAGLGLALLGLVVLTSSWANDLLLAAVSAGTGKAIAAHWLERLRWLGLDLLVVGAGTAAAGALLQRRRVAGSIDTPPERSRWRPWIGWIAVLWLVITANTFALGFLSNEVDSLPSARQAVDPGWLPNDWYLNLDIGYRQPFNLVAGTLVARLGFLQGAYVGRVWVYLLVASALAALCRALRLRLWLALLVLVVFLFDQSLVAGEWIVGGVDTKSIAYAFVLLALAGFLQQRYFLGFACAGAALSFHVLVGLYALFCAVVALLLLPTWRRDWRKLLSRGWIFFVTGAYGLLEVARQLAPQPGSDTAAAWQIYVQLRVPHHVLPSAWPGRLWIVKLALATGLFLAVLLASRSQKMRFVAAYALASVALFLAGLGIYAAGQTALLRFYWFRFADVMAPLLALVLLAKLVDDFLAGRLAAPRLSPDRQAWLRTVISRSGPLLTAAAVLLVTLNALQAHLARPTLSDSDASVQPALAWIAANTAQDAVFLADPSLEDFYVSAQRALFVSFKHSPQSPAELLEWYERIQLAHRGPQTGPAAEAEASAAFYAMDADEIRQVAATYGVSHYLGRPEQALPFERIFNTPEFTVYTGLTQPEAGPP